MIPFIVGKEGRKKKEIEHATGATLNIPRRNQQQPSGSSSNIIITAPDKQSLSRARLAVEQVISTALSGRLLDYTHFLSLPLSNADAAATLHSFQEQVMTVEMPFACKHVMSCNISIAEAGALNCMEVQARVLFVCGCVLPSVRSCTIIHIYVHASAPWP